MNAKHAIVVLLILFTCVPGAQSALSSTQRTIEVSSLPLPASTPYKSCFDRASQRHGIPVRLLAAVARVESAFDPFAVSHMDAVGIMQIRWPLTAKHLGIKRRELLFNPCLNIDAGARYLSELISRFETLEQALAAYNMGPSRISTDANAEVPALGRKYVDLVAVSHDRITRTAAASERIGGARKVLEFPVKTRERAAAVEAALAIRYSGIAVTLSETADGWTVQVMR